MTFSDNSTQTEGLGDFFKILGKKGVNVSTKMAKNFFQNPGIAFKIGANVGVAFAFRSTNAALSSSPEVINFYHTCKGVYFGNYTYLFMFLSNK